MAPLCWRKQHLPSWSAPITTKAIRLTRHIRRLVIQATQRIQVIRIMAITTTIIMVATTDITAGTIITTTVDLQATLARHTTENASPRTSAKFPIFLVSKPDRISIGTLRPYAPTIPINTATMVLADDFERIGYPN